MRRPEVDWPFDDPPAAPVVTSNYVTDDQLPILYVSHERDEGGDSLWQFHCGNGDYHVTRMRLVRLDTVLAIDPSIAELADLPLGWTARRVSVDGAWLRDGASE